MGEKDPKKFDPGKQSTVIFPKEDFVCTECGKPRKDEIWFTLDDFSCLLYCEDCRRKQK